MTSKRYNVSMIFDAKHAAGGWNELAKITKVNRGTLKYIAEGKRNPSPEMAKRLMALGLIVPIRRQRNHKPVPWRKVAAWLADNPANMVTALVIHGVERSKSEQIAGKMYAG